MVGSEARRLKIGDARPRLHRPLHRVLQREVAVAGIILALGGCANDYPPDRVPPVPSAQAAPALYRPSLDANYTIGPSDHLLIQSFYYPNLKQPVTVRSDGRVSLLLVGDVMVAGKTPHQLAEELAKDYRQFLKDVDLTVMVTKSAGLAVYVTGSVERPQMIPLNGELTLLQSIAQAGGFLSTANKRQVLILRQMPDGRYHTLQANTELALNNTSGEIYLRRHDIVYVPKTEIAKVDQFVDQYINQIIPHSVNTVFNYTINSQTGGAAVINSGH
jgi:polysaccharide biosynthesis/export protein